MEGVFGHLVFGMRRKEKARKEKKPVDWTYPIFTPSTPSTSYYSSVIAQADVEPYSWTVRFTLKSFAHVELTSFTLSYTC